MQLLVLALMLSVGFSAAAYDVVVLGPFEAYSEGHREESATKCDDCKAYCECTFAAKRKLDRPAKMVALGDLKGALEECHVPETEPSTKNTDKIEKFFACRNAKCSCAEDVAPAVGLALGMDKPLVDLPETPGGGAAPPHGPAPSEGATPPQGSAPPQDSTPPQGAAPSEGGKTRRRREAEQKSASSEMLACLGEKLNVDEAELSAVLGYYKAVEETYMFCYETECREEKTEDADKDIATADKRCSLFAGFSD